MRTSELSILVALCACSVPQIDYTGKACLDGVCPAGYECNHVTQTCAKDIAVDGSVDPDEMRSPDAGDDVVVDSCFPNPRSKLVYASDDGFSDYPQTWLDGGDGQWERQANELYQASSTADISWLSRPSIGGSGSGGEVSDYRIVATMRLGDLSDGSVGIAFRVGPTTMYSCAVDPVGGRLALRFVQPTIQTSFASKTVTMSDPLAPFTMEVDATGTTLSCCIRGVSGATLAGSHEALPLGSAGLTTRNDEGLFSSFHAYQ
jgi:hypothetical protein